jgi:ribonuclease P protein component
MTSTPIRLQRRRDFVRVAGAGRKTARPGLVLQAALGPDGDTGLVRIGFTATKRIGNAVVRNRVRRRLKAAVAEIMPAHAVPGFDYVLIGRAGTADRPYDALCRDLVAALKRLELYQDAIVPTGGTGQV